MNLFSFIFFSFSFSNERFLLLLTIDSPSTTIQDLTRSDGITKQGYLMKGPEIGSDRMFVHIGSKSFKRRYCHLRQEVDGTYILELFKDEKKGEAKLTIVMDFCSEVVRNSKRGRYCFELRMSGTHKSYSLAADSETELQDWLLKLSSVLQHYKQQEEKRAASLERACNTPPPSPQPQQVTTLLDISLLEKRNIAFFFYLSFHTIVLSFSSRFTELLRASSRA